MKRKPPTHAQVIRALRQMEDEAFKQAYALFGSYAQHQHHIDAIYARADKWYGVTRKGKP